jgi:hypothetical protein
VGFHACDVTFVESPHFHAPVDPIVSELSFQVVGCEAFEG